MGKKNRAERHERLGRRRRYSAERPLELEGSVELRLALPARWARLSRWLVAFVGALPTYRSGTREGRGKVLALRTVVSFVALMLVGLGRERWYWGLTGVAVAVLLFIVPLADVRRRRLLDAARRLGRPGERWEPTAAEVHYDGKKLSVRAAGRTWKSLRPAAVPLRKSVGRSEGWLYLVLTAETASASRREPFRIRVRAAEVPEGAGEEAVDVGPAVTVDAEGWALLVEQLGPRGSGVKPPG